MRLVSLMSLGLATAAAGQSGPVRAAVGQATYLGAAAGGLAVFKGIPFAEPPVGALRWKPPVPAVRTGTQPATTFGPQCMQNDRLQLWLKSIATVFNTVDKIPPHTLATSEDCLYLNVWSPKLGGKAPVMVWIHGGSNQNGSGAEALYDGSALARLGVVVVTINYRLGFFGFLAHPAFAAESPNHSAGNYGLLDQLEALRWVRANIAAFGGDPRRVTVFGESAGSIDLLHLVASPLAKGLFDRAIAQSGAPMARMNTAQGAGAVGRMFAKALGVDTAADVAAALRAKPASEVLAAQVAFPGVALVAGPVVDGWVLPDMTPRIFERGEQAEVSLMIGSNAFEMTTLRAYLPQFPRTQAGFRQWAGQTFGPAADTVVALYRPADDGAVEEATMRVMTDAFMTCPTRIAAKAMAGAGRKTWRYFFTRVAPGGASLGAFHAAEIAYVFGSKPAWLPRDATDEALSRAMMGYWTRFAATGDPNGGGAPMWPASEGAADGYLELGDRLTGSRGVRTAACDAMEGSMRAQWSKD